MGIETLSRGNQDNHDNDYAQPVSDQPISDPSDCYDQRAADLLSRVRAVVDPALRAAVETMPESMARIAAYHFGWREADGSPATADPGKAIRPALVLAAAQACAAGRGVPRPRPGGTPNTPAVGASAASADTPAADVPAVDNPAALAAAAAVELVHNFTLLHDDVIDRDETRRHRPTAWRVFGATEAILAGDALHSLALRTLAEDPHPAAAAAMRHLAQCVVELCAGQQADCAFEQRTTVSLAECLAMAEAKTGALLGSACAIGALYGGASTQVAQAMDAFGRQIGLAFQLIDDLIGIWGDPAVTGKPAGADLMVRKKSLPVVAALGSGTAAGAELAEIYAIDRPLTPAEVQRAADAVERAGGRAWAQGASCERMAAAIEHLAIAVPDPAATDDLLALAELVTRRNR